MKNIMKMIALALCMVLISLNTMAQKTGNVPQTIQTAFSVKYPQARLKKWEVKKDTIKAYFTLENKKYHAAYSPNGVWLSTERIIRHVTTLPPAAQSYLKTSTYASWTIDDMLKVGTPSQNLYEVYLDNSSGQKMMYENVGSASYRMLSFDTNGKLLKIDDAY